MRSVLTRDRKRGAKAPEVKEESNIPHNYQRIVCLKCEAPKRPRWHHRQYKLLWVGISVQCWLGCLPVFARHNNKFNTWSRVFRSVRGLVHSIAQHRRRQRRVPPPYLEIKFNPIDDDGTTTTKFGWLAKSCAVQPLIVNLWNFSFVVVVVCPWVSALLFTSSPDQQLITVFISLSSALRYIVTIIIVITIIQVFPQTMWTIITVILLCTSKSALDTTQSMWFIYLRCSGMVGWRWNLFSKSVIAHFCTYTLYFWTKKKKSTERDEEVQSTWGPVKQVIHFMATQRNIIARDEFGLKQYKVSLSADWLQIMILMVAYIQSTWIKHYYP